MPPSTTWTRMVLKGPRFLACPFYKQEPAVYQKCDRAGLLSVEEVFEHLQNRHAAPIHCGRCYVEFSSNDGRERHVRDGCVQMDWRKADGYCVTTQSELFDLQTDLSIQDDLDERQEDTDEELRVRWGKLFSILFPGIAQPRSSFVDSECNGTVSAANSGAALCEDKKPTALRLLQTRLYRGGENTRRQI